MTPIKTLVVLASEAEAKFLVNEGPGKGLREHSGLRADDFPDTDQEFTDQPGRQTAAPGMGSHSYTARETVQDARRTTFAGLILEATEEARAATGSERIVLAASPKLLGELRARMPERLAKAVTAQLPKDLVKVPLIDLARHFDDVAAF